MFNRRKYSRKKERRRAFRPRVHKRRLLRPPSHAPASPAPPAPPPPLFDAAGCATYPWPHLPPCGDFLQPNPVRRRLLPLRQICAQHLANAADALEPEYLDQAPWSCWQPVWRAILERGRDTPRVFLMFAATFGAHPAFACHHSRAYTYAQTEAHNAQHKTRAQKETDADVAIFSEAPVSENKTSALRHRALALALVPTHCKHRIDNFFSNVGLEDWAALVARAHCSVVADCSAPPFSRRQLLAVCLVPSLVALDLSGNPAVDDQFLYTLRASLSHRLLLLKIVRLCRCPNITLQGLLQLLKEPTPLAYVEADVVLPTARFALEEAVLSQPGSTSAPGTHYGDGRAVLGTQWRLLDERKSANARVAGYPLALKVHYLLRNTDLVPAPKVMWDIKFFAQTLSTQDRAALVLAVGDTWLAREKQVTTRSAYVPHCYLLDPAMEVKYAPELPRVVEDRLVFQRQGALVLRKKNARKPRMVATDASSFFGT